MATRKSAPRNQFAGMSSVAALQALARGARLAARKSADADMRYSRSLEDQRIASEVGAAYTTVASKAEQTSRGLVSVSTLGALLATYRGLEGGRTAGSPIAEPQPEAGKVYGAACTLVQQIMAARAL